jgi:hypothetical protein
MHRKNDILYINILKKKGVVIARDYLKIGRVLPNNGKKATLV